MSVVERDFVRRYIRRVRPCGHNVRIMGDSEKRSMNDIVNDSREAWIIHILTIIA